MTLAQDVPILALDIIRATPWDLQFVYSTTQSAEVWVASRAYVAGQLVISAPNNLGPFPPIFPLYYQAQTTGTTGSTPPSWPTSYGQTVVDGGVTWKTVQSTTNPVDITGWTATHDFLTAPDDPNPPIFSLTSLSGGIIVSGSSGLLTEHGTSVQAGLLLTASSYGFHKMTIAPPSGDPVRAFHGPWRVTW